MGYIELVLTEKSKEILKGIVGQIVSKDQFYYSDVVHRINGDVTSKAHLTLFFGFTEGAIENTELIQFANHIEIKNLEIKNLDLLDGYEGQYKILIAVIKDSDKNLENLTKECLKFEHDEELGKRKFKPHVTLAYVSKDYELPNDFKVGDLNLKIEKVALRL